MKTFTCDDGSWSMVYLATLPVAQTENNHENYVTVTDLSAEIFPGSCEVRNKNTAF